MFFGRGASDDKGNILAPIVAIEAYLETNGSLPVNVKFFYEGQEEIGSPNMLEFIKDHGVMLSADMIFSSDGSQSGLDQPSLVMGLKGLVGCEIKVTGEERDLYSGLYVGGIANPIHALFLISESMKNQDGKITVDGFYDVVVDLSIQDRTKIANVPFDEDDYCKSVGATEAFGELGFTVQESLSARHTLKPNCIWYGYQRKGIKTVLPSEASAKITCHLFANQEPGKIYESLSAHVEENTPMGVIADVSQLPGSTYPFLIPKEHNSSEIVRSVLQKLFDQAPYEIEVGVSIPVMSTLLEELGVHATMLAFGLDAEQIHAPNKFFRLESFEKAQKAYCMLLEEFQD